MCWHRPFGMGELQQQSTHAIQWAKKKKTELNCVTKRNQIIDTYTSTQFCYCYVAQTCMCECVLLHYYFFFHSHHILNCLAIFQSTHSCLLHADDTFSSSHTTFTVFVTLLKEFVLVHYYKSHVWMEKNCARIEKRSHISANECVDFVLFGCASYGDQTQIHTQ